MGQSGRKKKSEGFPPWPPPETCRALRAMSSALYTQRMAVSQPGLSPQSIIPLMHPEKERPQSCITPLLGAGALNATWLDKPLMSAA